MSETTSLEYKIKFLELSSALTGFDSSEVQGTGLVDYYYQTLIEVLGNKIFEKFLAEISLNSSDQIKDVWLPICDNIVKMWYLGKWFQIDLTKLIEYSNPNNTTKTLGPVAYREALAWRVISSNPPGAKQPGYGSWSVKP